MTLSMASSSQITVQSSFESSSSRDCYKIMNADETCSLYAYSREEYRTAIAFNNMAVTMVERCCYKQALATLKDSIFAMKLVVKQPSQSSIASCRRRIQNAHRRIAQPAISPITVSGLASISHDTTPEEIHFVPKKREYRHSMNRNKHIQQDQKQLLPCYLIRIETSECEFSHCADNNQVKNEADLPTAIILYNFGVSALCCAKTSVHASSQHQESAIKLFLLSRNILEKIYDKFQEDPFMLPRLIAISAILFRALHQSLRVIQQEQGSGAQRGKQAIVFDEDKEEEERNSSWTSSQMTHMIQSCEDSLQNLYTVAREVQNSTVFELVGAHHKIAPSA